MDQKGKTYWEMEKESISYVRKNENVWAKMAVLAANVEALEGNERELDRAFKAQGENDPGGYVAQKNELFTAFFRKVYKLSRRLSFYAKDTGDSLLLNNVTTTESTFLLLPEKEALIRCNSLIKQANDYVLKAANYGINAEYLKSLAAELTALEKIHPMIGMVTNDRKSARRSIRDLISEAHFILGKLDDGFEGMVEDGEFLDGWYAIRKIKGRRKPKAKSALNQAKNN